MNGNERMPRKATMSFPRVGVIQAAMRLASDDAVTSIRVVTRDRPSYPELVELRQEAHDRGLTLYVSGDGVSLKRRREGLVLRGQPHARPLPDRVERPSPPVERGCGNAAASRLTETWIAPIRHWLNAHGRGSAA